MKIFLALLIMSGVAYAGTSVTKNWAMPAPPTQYSDANSLYDFLNFLYTHFNQAQITTTSPNGSRKAKAGEYIIYNNAGTYQFCVETAQPSGTTWKCANLS